MKRSPMKRGKPPSRKSRLTRKTRVRKKNAKRAAKRKAEAFGPQAELCRSAPCFMCGGEPSEPHHEPPRSVGGRDCDCVPLCRPCHDKRHRRGARAFWGDVDWMWARDKLRARVAREAA